MKKRIITLILAIALTLALLKPAATAQRLDFVDLGGHWVLPFLEQMHREGVEVFSGIYEGGNLFFHPERPITRAMFATTLVRMFDLHDETAVNPFDDVCDNAWYAPHVSAAVAAGIIHGTNPEGTIFQPNLPVTRQEAFVMAANIALSLPYFDAVDEQEWADILGRFPDNADVAPWATEATVFVIYRNIAAGDNGRLRPQNNMTRAEAATILVNLFERIRVARIWYNAPPPLVIHTVSFTRNDGSTGDENIHREWRIIDGHAVNIPPPAPVRYGYDFYNWSYDSAGNYLFDFESPITADLTLYAKWTAWPPLSDASALQMLFDESLSLTPAALAMQFTQESYAVFLAARSQAFQVLSLARHIPRLEQAIIDNAYDALRNAIDNLAFRGIETLYQAYLDAQYFFYVFYMFTPGADKGT